MLLMGICQKGSAGLWASPSPPIMTSYKSDLPSALFHTAPSQRQNSPPNIINPPSFSFQISFKASLITTLQPRQMLPQRVRSWRKGRAWASLCAEERGTESWIPFGEGVKMPMWRPDLRTQPSGLHVGWAGSLSSIPEFSLRRPGDGQQRTLVPLSEPQGRCGSV